MRFGAIYRPAPAVVPGLHARAALDRLVARPAADWFACRPADGDCLGNDERGNCVECSAARQIEVWRMNAFNDAWRPTTAFALGLYAAWAGFDPATGQNDEGTDTAHAMALWSTKGVQVNEQDLDVIHWLTVDVQNMAHIRLAIDLLGGVQLTMRCPRIMESDPTALSRAPGTGADWEASDCHRILGAAYDGDTVTVYTWGERYPVHPEFWARYFLAADAAVSRQWCRWADTSPLGLDFDQLAADTAAIAAGG